MANPAIDVLAGPDAVCKATIPAVGADLTSSTTMVAVHDYVKSLRMRGPYRTSDVTNVGNSGSRVSRGSTDDAMDIEFIGEGDFIQRMKKVYRTRNQEVEWEVGPDGDTASSNTEKITFQAVPLDAPHEIAGGEGEQRFSMPWKIQGQPVYGVY